MDEMFASANARADDEDCRDVGRPPHPLIGRTVYLDVFAGGDACSKYDIVVEDGEGTPEVATLFVAIGDREGLSKCAQRLL